MKIVFEEKDINEILTAHVKSQNLLGLADKDFSIELEINGDEVSANLDTDVASLVGDDSPKKAAPKKRRTKSAPKKEEPEVAAEDTAPEPEAEKVPMSKQAVVEPEPEDEEEETKDSKPPFKTEEEEEAIVRADSKPRKSLFV